MMMTLPTSVAYRLGFVRDIDSSAYVAMADGRWGEVLRPFSNRVLGPVIAHHIGFEPLQVLAGLTFLLSVIWLLRRSGTSVVRALPFLVAPWVLNFAFNVYMPDLLACALTALMFVVFARFGAFAAMPVLALMMMARESSVVVAGVWMALLARNAWKTRKLEGRTVLTAVGVLLSVIVGMKLVRIVSAASPGDINGLGILYMPIKAMANAVVSVTGLHPWNDVYARELPHFYQHLPIWKMTCPGCLRFGRFTEVGIYEWHPWQLLGTLKLMLIEFGVLVPYALRHFRALRGKCAEPWQELAFWSGLVYWLITPICGFSPARYVGYAWPLVWLFPLNLLVSESRRMRLALAGVHGILIVVAML